MALWGLTGIKAFFFDAMEDTILLVCGVYCLWMLIKADVIEIIQDEFEEKKDLPGFKELWAEKTGGDNDDEKDE